MNARETLRGVPRPSGVHPHLSRESTTTDSLPPGVPRRYFLLFSESQTRINLKLFYFHFPARVL